MSLHIEVVGNGPALVLIHGWALHGGVFAPLVDRLAAHYQLHLVDLPGHGLTVVPRRINNFLPLPDGAYLLAGTGLTQAEVRRFSVRDAQQLPMYEQRLEVFADVLRKIAAEQAPKGRAGDDEQACGPDGCSV